MVQFPDGFLWGAATAAYQIEGAVGADGRGRSIWDTFSHTPGRTCHGDTGDIACDHYHRLDADLDLMAALGLKAYRFSVAWPRVQPTGRGPANPRGLDFYGRLVDGLHARGIVPMLTLYHWDLPQALQDAGGWPHRDTAYRFAEYAALVYDALGGAVPHWITLNEPWAAAWLGHAVGVHAPGLRDEAAALAAGHHLLLGHGLAVRALRERGRQDTALGITLVLTPVHPAPDDPAAAEPARRFDGVSNRLWLDPLFLGHYPDDVRRDFAGRTDFGFVRPGDLEIIGAPLDFVGVNYYMRQVATSKELAGGAGPYLLPPSGRTTAMGWPIVPAGLTEVLLRVAEYTRLPLYVTENGAAFDDYVDPEGAVDDEERIDYLDAHFRAAHAAIARGVDLRGYFVWSLMDNFEWAEGYGRRFGLVYVDYRDQTRLPKRSAHWFRDVIAGFQSPPDANAGCNSTPPSTSSAP